MGDQGLRVDSPKNSRMLRLRIAQRLGLLAPLMALYRYAERADARLDAQRTPERQPELS
jgi:hypothetical protein